MSRTLVDSGIKYLGKIPSDWKVAKYKLFASSRMGETILGNEVESKGVPIYSATQEDKIFGYIKEPKIILNKGDLVIPARGNSIGCVSKIKEDKATCTQTTICSYNFRNINSNFLYYCILGLNNEWFRYDGSAIPQITVEQVKNSILALPPKEEQTKIADYLDDRCSKIDKVIEDNNKEIELLEEYKKSIVSKLIRRGIKDSASKDTNISYIGKIPINWTCVKFDKVFEIVKRIAGTEGYAVLSITQGGIKIKDIESNAGQLASDYSKYQFVNIGDFAMNHMDLLTGWVDCSKYNGVTSPDYRVFKLKNEEIADKRFCLYYLQLCYKEKIFYGFGQGVSNLGRWRLPKDEFLNTYIPLPKLEEQVKICDYLDRNISLIDKVIKYRKQIIEKLEEYKKSLIYEVVTGKKEV